MIELIDALPDRVIGFRFSGDVSRDEYTQVVLPALKERLKGDDGVRLLVLIDQDFDKFEPGALWEDVKFGLGPGLAHLSKWERTALVSDAPWVRHAITLFGWMVPGDVRVFTLSQLEEAKTWLAG
jgi:SpoIIAA-like